MIDLKAEQPVVYDLLKAKSQRRPSSRTMRTRQMQRLLLVDIVDQMIDQQCAVVVYGTYTRACIKKDVVKQRNAVVARVVKAECVSVAMEVLAEVKHEHSRKHSVESIPEPLVPADPLLQQEQQVPCSAQSGKNQSEDLISGLLASLIAETVRESCLEVAQVNQQIENQKQLQKVELCQTIVEDMIEQSVVQSEAERACELVTDFLGREVLEAAMADLELQRKESIQRSLCTDLIQFLEDIVVQEVWEGQVEELALQQVSTVP